MNSVVAIKCKHFHFCVSPSVRSGRYSVQPQNHIQDPFVQNSPSEACSTSRFVQACCAFPMSGQTHTFSAKCVDLQETSTRSSIEVRKQHCFLGELQLVPGRTGIGEPDTGG